MGKRDKSILIVDDDRFLIDMYSLKFKEEGFAVSSAQGGEEAISQLGEGKAPDVVLLDLIMPGIDGLAVLKTVKERKLAQNSLFIVLSNQSQEGDIARARELGAAHYIVKASAVPSEVVLEVKKKLEARGN